MIHALCVVCQYVDLTLLYKSRRWMEIEINYYAVNFISCIDNITRSTLWSKAAANTKHNFCIITLKKPVAPKTESKKICVHSPIHTTNRTSDDPSDGTLPDSPPQNKSKKSANPHPYTWSKNPYIAKAIWGIEKTYASGGLKQNLNRQLVIIEKIHLPSRWRIWRPSRWRMCCAFGYRRWWQQNE